MSFSRRSFINGLTSLALFRRNKEIAFSSAFTRTALSMCSTRNAILFSPYPVIWTEWNIDGPKDGSNPEGCGPLTFIG